MRFQGIGNTEPIVFRVTQSAWEEMGVKNPLDAQREVLQWAIEHVSQAKTPPELTERYEFASGVIFGENAYPVDNTKYGFDGAVGDMHEELWKAVVVQQARQKAWMAQGILRFDIPGDAWAYMGPERSIPGTILSVAGGFLAGAGIAMGLAFALR